MSTFRRALRNLHLVLPAIVALGGAVSVARR
jgi:hypothetical protein